MFATFTWFLPNSWPLSLCWLRCKRIPSSSFESQISSNIHICWQFEKNLLPFTLSLTVCGQNLNLHNNYNTNSKMFKGPIIRHIISHSARSLAQLIVRQFSTKTEALLYIPHVWKGKKIWWLHGNLIGWNEYLAEGAVTNMGDITVPLVTSKRDESRMDFSNFWGVYWQARST